MVFAGKGLAGKPAIAGRCARLRPAPCSRILPLDDDIKNERPSVNMAAKMIIPRHAFPSAMGRHVSVSDATATTKAKPHKAKPMSKFAWSAEDFGGAARDEEEREAARMSSVAARMLADEITSDPDLLALLFQRVAERAGCSPEEATAVSQRMRAVAERPPSPPPPPPTLPQHVRVSTLELALANPECCVQYNNDGDRRGVDGYDPDAKKNKGRPIRSTISNIWSHCVTRDGTRFVCSGAGVYRVVDSSKVEILAGSEDEKGTGCRDGVGTEARFNGPSAIAECPDGNLVRLLVPNAHRAHACNLCLRCTCLLLTSY